MIKVTRLNNVPLILNSDLIEHVDATPDTVIALVSGQKYMVQETPEEIVDRVVKFRQSLLCGDRNEPASIASGRLVTARALGAHSVNG